MEQGLCVIKAFRATDAVQWLEKQESYKRALKKLGIEMMGDADLFYAALRELRGKDEQIGWIRGWNIIDKYLKPKGMHWTELLLKNLYN